MEYSIYIDGGYVRSDEADDLEDAIRQAFEYVNDKLEEYEALDESDFLVTVGAVGSTDYDEYDYDDMIEFLGEE